MNTYLSSKPRYEILDGLRGVAAILVLLYHHFEIFCMSDPMMPFINHGYLAVDFFFILSGFVIGYAYDDRWDRMSLWQFFKRRLTRLHPMIIFATIMCMCTFYLGMGEVFPLVEKTSFGTLLFFGVLSILMIPIIPSWDIRGWQETNPINGNAWTLYFEYLANIAYALVIRRFPKWLLTIFVLLTAVLTIDLTLNLNIFGFLTEQRCQSSHAYTVIGGWTTNLEQGYIGYARLLFPFFCGLLISRFLKGTQGVRHLAVGFWWTTLFLMVILCMPRIGDLQHSLYNGIFEAISILFIFPIIVMMGASSHVTGRSLSICKWLGGISYPLYVTHYGIVFGILQPWSAVHPGATVSQQIGLSLGSILASIFIAHTALKFYDEPVRNWLKEHWLKRSSQK